MKLQAIACAFAEAWTSANRKPMVILLFVPVCAVLIAVGWLFDSLELLLLIVTTALSIDASLTGRMGLLKQAQASGDEPTTP